MVTSKITSDPEIMLGKPVITGTRITVEILLKKLAENLSTAQILKDYPQLTEDDIKAAIDYARASLSNEDIHIIKS